MELLKRLYKESKVFLLLLARHIGVWNRLLLMSYAYEIDQINTRLSQVFSHLQCGSIYLQKGLLDI